jgi:hypothetical protein
VVESALTPSLVDTTPVEGMEAAIKKTGLICRNIINYRRTTHVDNDAKKNVNKT